MGSTGKSISKGGQTVDTAPVNEQQPPSNTALDNFRNMSSLDAANVVAGLGSTFDPQLNNYSSTQSLVDHLGMHEKPVVLDDATFDNSVADNALDGRVLYRGYGHQNDSAVVDSVKFGDKTYIGDGVHGAGIYFTTRRRYAAGYSSGNKQYSTITAYIDKNRARVIDESSLRSMFAQENQSIRSRFRGFSSTEEAISNYAIYRGYNVIYAEGGNSSGKHNSFCGDFYIPLTRDVLVIRDNTLMH